VFHPLECGFGEATAERGHGERQRQKALEKLTGKGTGREGKGKEGKWRNRKLDESGERDNERMTARVPPFHV
jgi:hypothetical protein